MHLTIELPEDIAHHLRQSHAPTELERVAVEQLALAGYLSGTLSQFQVQRMLGFDSRWDAERWLGAQGATLQYSLSDLEADRANLSHLASR